VDGAAPSFARSHPSGYDERMKLPKWMPDPIAWLNAVALYFFGMGVTIVFMLVLPYVFDLIERSPRLGWLALLAVWLSPIPAASVIHRIVQGVLDAADGKRTTTIGSVWAGLFAWMAFLFVNIATALIMLVLDPPPMDPPDSFVMELRHTSLGVQSIVWIVVAALVHHVERKARSTD
jgi:hypothetical protein